MSLRTRSRRVYLSSLSLDTPPQVQNADSLTLRKKYDDALFKTKESHRRRLRATVRHHEEALSERDATIRALRSLLWELERRLLDGGTNADDTHQDACGTESTPMQRLLDQIDRLTEQRDRLSSQVLEDGCPRCDMMGSMTSLNTSMESLDSVCTSASGLSLGGLSSSQWSLSRPETPQLGFCTTDTEKQLEGAIQREQYLEGEIEKLKDDNAGLRDTVSRLQERQAVTGAARSLTCLQGPITTDRVDQSTEDPPGRGSLMVKNGHIAMLEKQQEFLKEQLTEKTQKLILCELALRQANDAAASRPADDGVLEAMRRDHQGKLQRRTEELESVQRKLAVVAAASHEVRASHDVMRGHVVGVLPQVMRDLMADAEKQLTEKLKSMDEANRIIVKKYMREMELRKKYHNELVELKGGIRVLCRVRPRIPEDGDLDPDVDLVLTPDPLDDHVVHVVNAQGRGQTFDVDRVFGMGSTQEEVFNEVSSLVRSAIDGYSVCIFAYGQTGSGKTYTMEGAPSAPGISPRALQLLFQEVTSQDGWAWRVTAGVMEVYNDAIRDLLNPDPSARLEVKMRAGGGLHVPGQLTREVTCLDDVNEVFECGRANRATASTDMNERSSRSHCLLTVSVEGRNLTTGVTVNGRLNLVDLAGSERIGKTAASGDRLKEAQSINKSLACLGDVMHALRNKHAHVPYRNSKLTYLLQDSLGGDSKTLMIVQVSPVHKNLSESVCSLAFGQRVRRVELGQATKGQGQTAKGQEMLSQNSKRPSNLHLPARPTTPSKLSPSLLRKSSSPRSSNSPRPFSPQASPLTVSSAPVLENNNKLFSFSPTSSPSQVSPPSPPPSPSISSDPFPPSPPSSPSTMSTVSSSHSCNSISPPSTPVPSQRKSYVNKEKKNPLKQFKNTTSPRLELSRSASIAEGKTPVKQSENSKSPRVGLTRSTSLRSPSSSTTKAASKRTPHTSTPRGYNGRGLDSKHSTSTPKGLDTLHEIKQRTNPIRGKNRLGSSPFTRSATICARRPLPVETQLVDSCQNISDLDVLD